jgi:hypothetical protein
MSTPQDHYARVLRSNKGREVATQLLKEDRNPTLKRFADKVRNGLPYFELFSDVAPHLHDRLDDKLVAAITVVFPEENREDVNSTPDQLNETVTLENPLLNNSVGGRKSRKRGQRKTRKHRKTRHRR